MMADSARITPAMISNAIRTLNAALLAHIQTLEGGNNNNIEPVTPPAVTAPPPAKPSGGAKPAETVAEGKAIKRSDKVRTSFAAIVRIFRFTNFRFADTNI